MPHQLREFVLENTDPADAQSFQGLADALSSRFRVTADGSRTVRRVWLDTFDWRLHRAGVTLEYLSQPGSHELALMTRAGERLAVPVPRMKWPGLPGCLPPGHVRDRIAAIAGVRALLPVVAGRSTQRSLRVLDGEDKTVARLTVDDTALRDPAAARLPPRVTIAAVRGYDTQADRVERLLSGLPGIAAATQSAFHAALAATRQDAADETSDAAVALTASRPASVAVASLLLRLLDTAEANVGGVIRDVDTEFLHDLRIAVRRTRSALKLVGDALPGDLAARFAPEFRWLGQLTTPTRDLDVHLLGFESAAAGLVTAAPQDLAPLHDTLISYRAAEHRRLVRALRSARFTGLTRDWRAALSDVAAPTAARKGRAVPGGKTGPGGKTAPGGNTTPGSKTAPGGDTAPGGGAHTRTPIADLASARIRRAYRRLARGGAAITATSPEEDLHMVRKRGKELRYLLEFFASLHEPAAHRRAVRELKRLQDCLGDIQDGHVQREVIRALAARMLAEQAPPAATLLAMGELAAQIDAAASRARNDFGTRFAQFTSSRNAQNIATLTGAGAA